jgi:hypothetical protein
MSTVVNATDKARKENGISRRRSTANVVVAKGDLPLAFLPLDLASSDTTCSTPRDLLKIRR